MKRRAMLSLACGAIVAPSLVSAQGQNMNLSVTGQAISSLRAMRSEQKFLDLPGAPAEDERKRLVPLFNDLLDRLISGVQAHPQSAWVIGQMEPTVEAFHLEDTEARERCLAYIERIFVILGIPNDGGAFRKYMIIW